MISSKLGTLIMAVIACAVLWLIGGFHFSHTVGIVFVVLGIVLVGLAAGSFMNSPEPEHK
jgi:hypothetical protein